MGNLEECDNLPCYPLDQGCQTQIVLWALFPALQVYVGSTCCTTVDSVHCAATATRRPIFCHGSKSHGKKLHHHDQSCCSARSVSGPYCSCHCSPPSPSVTGDSHGHYQQETVNMTVAAVGATPVPPSSGKLTRGHKCHQQATPALPFWSREKMVGYMIHLCRAYLAHGPYVSHPCLE